MEEAGWDPEQAQVVADRLGETAPDVVRVLRFAAEHVIPRLADTRQEITAVLHALNGGFVPAGPSGSPLRGLVNVLPTGRNFYTVDPRAIPSQLAYETGKALADALIERYRAETGEYPRSVGLSVWGTSAMRTSGDDIAEVLALLGVRPEWDEVSRRVRELSVIPLPELGRPRIDVTVRISGFFRDAFPHAVAMLDDAVRMVAELDEPDDANYVRAHVRSDLAEHGDRERALRRIFGSAPGAYGAGLLQLIDSGDWRSDADLAEVYTAWGGFAYGRNLHGEPSAEDMRANYRRIAVAAKNTDTREHDIADSDDYFQYHGGMVATVRALTGIEPKAYIGDSTTPDQVRTRSLREETARVFRARVVNPRWLAAMRNHGYKAHLNWPPLSTTCSATTRPRGWSTTGCMRPSPRPMSWTPRIRSSSGKRTPGRSRALWSGSPRLLIVACGGSPTHRQWRRCAASTWKSRENWRTGGRIGRDPESPAHRYRAGRTRPAHGRGCPGAQRGRRLSCRGQRGSGRPGSTGDLVALREEICRRHITGNNYRIVTVPDPPRDRAPVADHGYGRQVRDWHAARARAYTDAIVKHTRPDEVLGFLVWGDPSLYDSTIRVVERIRSCGVDLDYQVIPGVSSVQLLAARHRIVLNRIGGPITVTTGRRLGTDVARGADTLVVFLDGCLSCAELPGAGWDIWWGANLGTASEELVAGRLGEVMDAIRAARKRAKAAQGWVMDVYLLRRAAVS